MDIATLRQSSLSPEFPFLFPRVNFVDVANEIFQDGGGFG